MRTNLDPFNLHDDSRLWDALKRSHLVESPTAVAPVTVHDDATLKSGTHTPLNKFDLETVIEDEGNNLSVGQVGYQLTRAYSSLIRISQRSLVSLARALVKDSKIIILDEATGMRDNYIGQHDAESHETASVDYETDHKIQDTIASEFKACTILCIARALNCVVLELSLH
jgi:ABC-type multidrug transport system fused ATPase/permease subunit